MTEDAPQGTPYGRPRRPRGRATGRRRREGPVHHARAHAVRGARGRRARADRAERGHDPRAGRDRRARGARRARAVRRVPAPTSTASACGSPAGCARSLVQATAPREFVQHARNPANDVRIGGTATVLAPAYGSPFVRDLDGGRRYGTIEDFRNFVKLAYSTPFLHHSGGTVCEPVDLPVNKRHYDMVYAHMRYSDKAVHGLGHASRNARRTRSRWRGSCSAPTRSSRARYILSLINANSPLVWDHIMLGSARAYAEANQAVIMTPVHPGGRDVAGHGGRGRRADPRRGARRHGVRAARAAGCAGGVRVVRVVDVDAVGRADVRDPRARARALHARGVRPAPRRAVPQRRVADGLEDPGRAGGVRVGEHAAAHVARRRELRAARGRMARGRSDHGLREVRDGPRSVRDDGGVRQGRGPQPERPGGRCHHRERSGPALPGHGPHPRELRDRVLPVVDGRQQQLRAVGGRGVARHDYPGERRMEEDARRVRASARSTTRSTRSSRSGSSGRRLPSPTRTCRRTNGPWRCASGRSRD